MWCAHTVWYVVLQPGYHSMQSKKWNPRCHVSKLKRNQSGDSLTKVDKLCRLKAVAVRSSWQIYSISMKASNFGLTTRSLINMVTRGILLKLQNLPPNSTSTQSQTCYRGNQHTELVIFNYIPSIVQSLLWNSGLLLSKFWTRGTCTQPSREPRGFLMPPLLDLLINSLCKMKANSITHTTEHITNPNA